MDSMIQIDAARYLTLRKAEADALVVVVLVTGNLQGGEPERTLPLGFVLCAKKVSDASGFPAVSLNELPHFDAYCEPPVGPGVWAWTLDRERPRTRTWRRLRRNEETRLCDEGADRLCSDLVAQVAEADRS